MAFNKVIINQVAHYIPDIEEISFVDPIEQAIYKIDEPFQEFLEQVLNFLPNSNITHRDAYLRCFIQVLEKILKTEMFTQGEIGKLKPVVLTFLDSEEPVIEINIDPLLLQRALQIISKYEIVDFSHTEKKILIVLEDITNDKTLDVEVNIPKIVDTAIIISSRSNPALMAALYAKGLCEHEDYMTLEECTSVNSLSLGTFRYNEDITSFNEFKYFTGVTAVVQNFMFDVPNLKEITLPSTVTSIGRAAFGISQAKYQQGLTSKLKYVRGCGNVEYAGMNAFQYCDELISVDFSKKLKTVSTFFNKCPKLKYIGDISNVDTFDPVNGSAGGIIRQSGLEKIYMPKLSTIPIKAFYLNSNLKDLTLDWKNITSIEQTAFGIDANEYKNMVIRIESIPSLPNLISLGFGAFQGCKYLKHIGDMPKLTRVGQYAFNLCNNLRSIGRLDACQSIGKSGFSATVKLEYIYLPICNSVESKAFMTYENPETEDTIEINRTVKFGLPYDQITFASDAFENCINTTIICNEVELTAEQYQAVGATKPGE